MKPSAHAHDWSLAAELSIAKLQIRSCMRGCHSVASESLHAQSDSAIGVADSLNGSFNSVASVVISFTYWTSYTTTARA